MLKPRQRHRFVFKMLSIDNHFYKKPLRVAITRYNIKRNLVSGYDLASGDYVALGPSFSKNQKTYNRSRFRHQRFDKHGKQVETDYTPHWWGEGGGGLRLSTKDTERILELFLEDLPIAEMVTSPIPHLRKIGEIIHRYQEAFCNETSVCSSF